MARLDSVLSFTRDDDADQLNEAGAAAVIAYNDNGGGSSDDDDEAGFEFAFAPPLLRSGGVAPADDLFAHGRILPAYPVFARSQDGDDDDPPRVASASHHQDQAAPDTYCAWAPRSAPGSPARGPVKSASTGEPRRFWRLPGLGGGRSHSDGKEKFVFLQPGGKQGSSNNNYPSSAPLQQKQSTMAGDNNKQDKNKKQSKKTKGKATEMDMATAHRRFYGKQQGAALPGAAERRQQSYLPYRTGIVGFFATAHALGKAHHPY